MAFGLTGFLKGIFIRESSDITKQFAFVVDSGATTGTTTTIHAAQTANRDITLPDSNGALLTSTSTVNISQLSHLPTHNRVLISDNTGVIVESGVTSTTLTYLDATSSIQTQLNNVGSNPMNTLGDSIYGGASGTETRLPGDTSNVRKFLRTLSVAGVAQAPAWDIVQAADLSGTVSIAHGGTGQTTQSTAINALLPNQATHAGEILTTDGTNVSWTSAGTGGVTNWTAFVPTGTWTTNSTYDGYKRLVGDGAEVLYRITLAGAPGGGNLSLDFPGDMPPDATFIALQGSSSIPVGSFLSNGTGTRTLLGAELALGQLRIFYLTSNATSGSSAEPCVFSNDLQSGAPYAAAPGDTVIVKYSYKVI